MTRKSIGKGPWRKGPPPSIGWWPASNKRDTTELRWWDGAHWSAPAHAYYDRDYAAFRASITLDRFAPRIMWRERAHWWSSELTGE